MAVKLVLDILQDWGSQNESAKNTQANRLLL